MLKKNKVSYYRPHLEWYLLLEPERYRGERDLETERDRDRPDAC